MTNSRYVTEVGYLSFNHVGEELCGDHIEVTSPDNSTKILVLADGLGSKSNSHYGSQALCRSVIEISVELQEDLVGINLLNYIDKIYQRWKTYVEPYEITECYTTMLLFVLYMV